jgi:hypothetical protein
MADCEIVRYVHVLGGTNIELIEHRPSDFVLSKEGAAFQGQL